MGTLAEFRAISGDPSTMLCDGDIVNSMDIRWCYDHCYNVLYPFIKSAHFGVIIYEMVALGYSLEFRRIPHFSQINGQLVEMDPDIQAFFKHPKQQSGGYSMSIMEQIFESLKIKPFEPFQLSKMGDRLFRINDKLLLERLSINGDWELEDSSLGLTNILNNTVEIIHRYSQPDSHNDAVWRYYCEPHFTKPFRDDSHDCGWQCSRCGQYADSLLNTAAYEDLEDKPKMKYCPNCGAHMIESPESIQEETKNDTNGNIFDGA